MKMMFLFIERGDFQVNHVGLKFVVNVGKYSSLKSRIWDMFGRHFFPFASKSRKSKDETGTSR